MLRLLSRDGHATGGYSYLRHLPHAEVDRLSTYNTMNSFQTSEFIMRIKALLLKNFRRYRGHHQIEIDDFTTIIGRWANWNGHNILNL